MKFIILFYVYDISFNFIDKKHIVAFLLYFLQMLYVKFWRTACDFHLGVPIMYTSITL